MRRGRTRARAVPLQRGPLARSRPSDLEEVRKGRRVSDPCAILTVRCSARAPRPRGAAQRYAPGCGEGRRSGALGAPGRRAAAPPRARRGTLRALRYAARPAARALRGGAAPGAVRCGARRAARAEHLTVSIAHGSLTRRPFLLHKQHNRQGERARRLRADRDIVEAAMKTADASMKSTVLAYAAPELQREMEKPPPPPALVRPKGGWY